MEKSLKWITHKTFAVAGTLALGLPLSTVIGSFFGSTLPDQIDFLRSNAGRNRKKWYQVHRGISHFWLLYTLIFIPLLHYTNTYLSLIEIELPKIDIPYYQEISTHLKSNNFLYDFLLGIFLGALSHLATDMLNPTGIPIQISKNWKKKYSLNLFKTGSLWEYLFLFSLVIFMGYYIKTYFIS